MKPEIRKLVIYSLFVAASIYGLLSLRSRYDKPIASVSNSPTESQVAPAVRPSKLIDIEKYSSMAWGRDPFVRNHGEVVNTMTASAPAPIWILGGILYDDLNPAAIINGRVVRTGELIKGALILKIDKNKVTLENNSGRFFLNLTKDKS